MIYFIAETQVKMGMVKIGYTKNVLQRLSALGGSSPYFVELILTIDGTKETEALLHEKFSDTRDHHEWFKLSESLADYIFEHLKDQGLLCEEDRYHFYEHLGLNKVQYTNYDEAYNNGWIGQIVKGIHLTNDGSWKSTLYQYTGKIHKRNSSTLFRLILSHLPMTGAQILEYTLDINPNVKRPKAFVRQFIRQNLSNGYIEEIE